ncbi:damage-inducible protein DinB [Bacillus pseudomycoides]|uniref:DinB family protein n=1 Tax=Bacillus pseudomycoides TaxID=64104 RepID=UPI000BECBFBC|nr:DinB family protein [Bacillus pseudomycoides]PDY02283.1 damage-inducible protein DinB [Bacillus pseudomycoides]PEE06741.1 damage-inducible protein DinB [Bacillus pseudomycoides]PEK78788.1 damage-inducible protein DinB [Bacillus pseudomycoides]PEM65726.1 damage-inducible protein DinB [Bacillus pseudomycoides]PEN07224.1 damage-inducible protein DinB [Bacillus pseudomycoides]
MGTLFRYNWQVRDQWFEWCKQLSEEDLLCKRVGGVGSILETLFHIVDVEYSWIRALQGKVDFELKFEDYRTLEKVKQLSDSFRTKMEDFTQTWSSNLENKILTASWTDETFKYGEVLRHVIAHEIHHIGQLSIWARQLNLQPVSANLIRRGLMKEAGNSIL